MTIGLTVQFSGTGGLAVALFRCLAGREGRSPGMARKTAQSTDQSTCKRAEDHVCIASHERQLLSGVFVIFLPAPSREFCNLYESTPLFGILRKIT